MLKRINRLALVGLLISSNIFAQNINSPYSRYGLGDIVPSQNILTRGMGGLSTAYADFQSINFLNPASYGQLQSVTYDVAAELDNLSILSRNPVRKFSNSSPVISYVNLGIPLKKGGGWGLVLGLRPMTRVKYKIQRTETIDLGGQQENMTTLFEGNGGSQQVYAGTGVKIGKFTIGTNIGYYFGLKEYSTRRGFNNDTVNYYKSNHQTNANYGGLLMNGGIQYVTKLGKELSLRLGIQGNLQQQIKGTRDVIRETFAYDASGAALTVDSVYYDLGVKGNIQMPASYSAGFMLDNNGKWQFGVDYSVSKWGDFRFFNEVDQVHDSWQLRAGGQVVPESGKSYWSHVAYRAGVTYGTDYINAGGDLTKWIFSVGMGLPMRRVTYTNQFSIINIAAEFGRRGNKQSIVQENLFQLAVGFSMSDIWFIKRKYD
jgi:hypothetical protein